MIRGQSERITDMQTQIKCHISVPVRKHWLLKVGTQSIRSMHTCNTTQLILSVNILPHDRSKVLTNISFNNAYNFAGTLKRPKTLQKKGNVVVRH